MLTVSGLNNDGLDALWGTVERHREVMTANGDRERRRAEQNARWMWAMVRDRLDLAFRTKPTVAALAGPLEDAVREGRMPASAAADRLLAAFGEH